jgi:hypothetical protein
MDGAQFDTLIKRLATTRLTRLAALRGLAVGAVASLTGVDFSADEAEAANSGKCRQKPGECERCDRGACHRKDGKKRCKRGKIKPTADGTLCSVGACQSGSCVPVCTPNTQIGCTPRVCNATGSACIDCTRDAQCGLGFECEVGRCVPASQD